MSPAFTSCPSTNSTVSTTLSTRAFMAMAAMGWTLPMVTSCSGTAWTATFWVTTGIARAPAGAASALAVCDWFPASRVSYQ